MRLGDLLKKAEIDFVSADMDMEISGVSFDSRTLKIGELFVAVRGYESDGHRYIKEAVDRGAVCILCEEKPGITAPHVIMRDTRKALAVVSAAWFGYPADRLKIIGITGTNGKTTVSYITKHILEKCSGSKVGLIGTNINMIGSKELSAKLTTPESYEIQELLAMMVMEGCEYVVMEVSSHALQLERVYGIAFEVGIFTNLSSDHLDFHKTMENYAKTKARLFLSCRNSSINIDDAYAHTMIMNVKSGVFTYAVKDDMADLVAKNVKLKANGVEFVALTIGNLDRTELRIPGMFSVYNALSAMSAAILLGFESEQVASEMRTCTGVKGRAEVVPTESDYTVLIDYAHTPDALENIIKAVRGFAQRRVITLFGCGGDRDKTKRPQMGEIAAKLSDLVVITSDNPRSENPNAIIDDIMPGVEKTQTPHVRIENRHEAIYWALENTEAKDVLILAGKGHETYQIIGNEEKYFDEREVVAEYFRNKREFQ